MTNHPPLYAPVPETPNKLFLAVAALLAVLPLALYVAITFFKAPIFANAWAIAIMPGWPLALFCAIQGLPNAPAPNAANAAAAPRRTFRLGCCCGRDLR
jgi:hypothetical protein